MKRIDERTIEVTPQEDVACDYFDELLDKGHGVPDAAKLALNRYFAPPGLGDQEFADGLSDGTVQRWGKRWRIKPAARGLVTKPVTDA
jgi:hypothetical protein